MSLIVSCVEHVVALLHVSHAIKAEHVWESLLIPALFNDLGGLTSCVDDSCCNCLVGVLLGQHELLLDGLQGKVVDMTSHLLERLPVKLLSRLRLLLLDGKQHILSTGGSALGRWTVVCEDHTLVQVIVDEVERRDRV